MGSCTDVLGKKTNNKIEAKRSLPHRIKSSRLQCLWRTEKAIQSIRCPVRVTCVVSDAATCRRSPSGAEGGAQRAGARASVSLLPQPLFSAAGHTNGPQSLTTPSGLLGNWQHGRTEHGCGARSLIRSGRFMHALPSVAGIVRAPECRPAPCIYSYVVACKSALQPTCRDHNTRNCMKNRPS